MKMDWSIKEKENACNVTIKRYRRFLEDKGYRPSTIETYCQHITRYIKFSKRLDPNLKDLDKYRENMFAEHLARSTINNASFAIEQYYKMMGEVVDLPILPRNDTLPYYFTEEDIMRIFEACRNIKHLTMLQLLFYGCLRASELCNLDDNDIDLKTLKLRIREGKGGRDGITYFTEECARLLRDYLKIRPPLVIDGKQPLFYTDFGNRWDRIELHRMFTNYKRKASIEKQGGLHVFSRHSPATIMISKGVPLNIVQGILRHKDIRTTLRYSHVNDKVTREWYNKSIRLDI